MLMDLTVVPLGCGRSVSTDLAKLIGRIDQSDCSIPTAGLAHDGFRRTSRPFRTGSGHHPRRGSKRRKYASADGDVPGEGLAIALGDIRLALRNDDNSVAGFPTATATMTYNIATRANLLNSSVTSRELRSNYGKQEERDRTFPNCDR